MTKLASGTFDVKMTPCAAEESQGSPVIARMALTKTYHGDLQATGQGQMLAVRTAVDGSAGDVAMERVSGTLDGRTGTFVLQHSGIMAQGAQLLTIVVVPDSATDDLIGLSGAMAIKIVDDQHHYALDYLLPDRPSSDDA